MKNHPLLFASAILIVVFASAGFAQSLLAAATTIGTNIVTTGSIGIGTASPLTKLHVGNGTTNNSSDSQILISRAVDDSVSGNGHAFSDSSIITRSGSMAYNSFDGRVAFSGSNDYNHYAAFQSAPVYGSSGTIDNIYSLFLNPTINTGTATNVYGAYIYNFGGTGTVTNNYGLYIEGLTKGTNRYAIYAAGSTLSYFGGSIGIGTSSPQKKLHVYNGSFGGTYTGSLPWDDTDLVIEDDTDAAINLISPSTRAGYFWFGDPTTATAGGLGYSHVADTMLFYTNAGERLRITSDGKIGIGTTTPLAHFQVTAPINATTTMEIGRAGSNKGSCIKLYDATGVAWYYTPAVGTGALTVASASSCASISGF